MVKEITKRLLFDYLQGKKIPPTNGKYLESLEDALLYFFDYSRDNKTVFAKIQTVAFAYRKSLRKKCEAHNSNYEFILEKYEVGFQ